MSFWNLERVRAAVGGRWAACPPGDRPVEATGVSTDTRTLEEGQVFVALRGEQHDGAAYLEAAAARGAAAAIVGEKAGDTFPRGLSVIRVADTRQALLRLGGAYRRTLERTVVVAVTGSNGKTTTVRLIDAVLGTTRRGQASPRSFNNAVGVPLTLLSARREDEYLVCEIGTNAPGEVAMLAQAVRPNVAVITGIGREHLEGLGSVEGVAREESSVVEFGEAGGVVVWNADAEILREHMRARTGMPTISFGMGREADLRVTVVRDGFEGVEFTLNDGGPYRVLLLGAHNAVNAAAAVAVGRRLGVDEAAIAEGLARTRGAEMRLEVVPLGPCRVVCDAYNANPESMLAALETLERLPGERKAAVLGDMLELGPGSAAMHAEVVGRALRVTGLVRLVTVGPLMGAAAQARKDARVTMIGDLTGEGARRAAEAVRGTEIVLLKASRRLRLERVLEAMREGVRA